MARVNNLSDFLTDVASAIKTKKGSSTAIPAANFDTEILALPSQGVYQTKETNITTNGNYEITPDTNYDAMDKLRLNVNVPTPQLQTKSYTFNQNTITTLTPETGYDGFSSVDISIDVPSEVNNQNKTIIQNGTYTADSGYTGLGEVTVNVPQEGGSGDVKLFETIADMQADTDPEDGDLAVVYIDTIVDLTETTEFQKAIFPKTVVLSSSTSTSRTIELRIDPTDSRNRLRGNWNRYEFYLSGSGSLSTYDIDYTSNDGLTYTLNTVNNKRVSSDTTVDFGVTLKFYSSGSSSSAWRDAFGKFIQITNREFNGFFVYNTDSYQIAPTQLDATSDYVYKKTYYGGNGVEEGTLATTVNNSFADVNANVMVEIQKLYNAMTPRILTDADKTIDKSIYLVPTKSDGTSLLDTSAVTDMSNMFSDCELLMTVSQLDTSNVTNMEAMFENCKSLLTVPSLDTSNVTNMNEMFYYCSSLTTVPLLNTSNVTSMRFMFYHCSLLTTVPLLDTSNVTDMYYVLQSCTSLTTIPLWDTSNVTNMSYAFSYCTALTIIPLLDTSNVTDMSSTFSVCSSLTTVPLLDTSSVTNMGFTFSNCTSLTSIPLLNTSSVTDMSSMFYYCSSLATVPLLDTSSVTTMSSMFYKCESLTTVPLLDTSNVTTMGYMFTDCSSLSNESLNNILQMCAYSAITTASNKTLKYIGLSETQATTCQGLSNYSAFTAAGWTTGY